MWEVGDGTVVAYMHRGDRTLESHGVRGGGLLSTLKQYIFPKLDTQSRPRRGETMHGPA